MNKAIFLDRDGTVNVEKNYLYKIEDFEFLPGVINALRKLQDAGFLLIIITNQSGIARGYYTEGQYRQLNDWMVQTLIEKGIFITAVYHCSHHPKGKIERYRINCNCRKPKTGLFERAVMDFDIDLKKSYAVGDRLRDCSICRISECQGFLLEEKEDKRMIDRGEKGMVDGIQYAVDLADAARKIIDRQR